MNVVAETMNSTWDGLVEYNTSMYSRLWAQATDIDIRQMFPYLSLTCMIMCFCIVRKPFFFVPHDNEEVTKRRKRAVQKKKYLDRLAAVSENQETVPRLDQDILVNVGDVSGTELRIPLIPKTKQGRPETVTVTIHFGEAIDYSGVEQLNGSLTKLCVAGEEGVPIRWLRQARALQGNVELRDSILNELESLYKIASDFNKDCTLQVDSWGILTKEGGWQLTVLEEEVPLIFHAEYAAGILKISGKHLKGAKIMVTAGQKSLKLDGELLVQEMKLWNRDKPVEMCVEYWRLPIRLSTQEINNVVVYATNTREVDDPSARTHSTAIQVNDVLWNTVFELWMTYNLLAIFIIVELVQGLIVIIEYLGLYLTIYFGWPLLVIITRWVFKSRMVWPRNMAHGFVRAVWTMYFGAADLIKREPQLSKSTGRGDSSPSFSKRPRTIAEPSQPIINTSTTTRSFVKSLLKQQRAENKNGISKAWEPCIVEKVSESSGKSVLRKVEKDEDDFDAENNPFAVIYRRERRTSRLDEVNVQVASEHLIKVLQKHLPYHGNLFCMERPEVPGRDIFTVVDTLTVEGADITQDQLSKAELHLDLLVQYIKKEFKDISLRLQRMQQEKLVSYDMMWAFLYPGQTVVYKCQYTQTLLCATISERLQCTNGRKLVKVVLDIYDFNGQTYLHRNISRCIHRFEGERLFESLPVCPISSMSRPQEVLEAEFVAHGRRFYELAIEQSYRFMNYQGPIFSPQMRSKFDVPSKRNAQENADGRVMIDTERFVSMNPGFRILGMDPSRKGPIPPLSRHSDDQFEDYSLATPEDLSDGKLMFAPGTVFGFSFALKQWGLFKVSGFSEVVYDSNAFNELVMEPEDKCLIYGLVSQYVVDPQVEGIDPISKKGEGCIVLCYGPPGTGKTLTAESVAENLRRPLWALSLSQLGTVPEELESALSRVLNVASSWQAILLLDEADIFLEKRTNNMDLGRNAMIGVILRQLEYYRGIMFLTTNRVSAFDDAVRSRVSLLVCYRPLTVTQRGQVWKNLLSRVGIHDFSILDELSLNDLNGREIRNIMRTAQVWAKSKHETLQSDHVKYVVKVFTRSVRTLEDGC